MEAMNENTPGCLNGVETQEVTKVQVISIDISKYPFVHVFCPIMKLRINKSLTERNPRCDYFKPLYNLNGTILVCFCTIVILAKVSVKGV